MALLGQDTSISGPLDEGVLLLETLQGKETLGTPYRYDLTLLSDDPAIPATKVLGQPMAVEIKLDNGNKRYFHGIVTYFAKLGLAMRHTRYAAVLMPKLSVFHYTRECRVFNDAANYDADPEAKRSSQNALTIITEVLKNRGLDIDPSGIKDHTYRDRKYCVQYRESDLNFVQRLLEEEGLYYFFKHAKGTHTMVLANGTAAHAPAAGYEEILYFPKERKQNRDEEHFWSLNVADSLYPGIYTLARGYDYTKLRPQQVQIVDKPSGKDQPGPDFEEYDYPTGHSEEAEATEEALVRMQLDQMANTVIEVEGNTMGIGLGDLVQLGRPHTADVEYMPFWTEEDFTKKYLVTSATYSISINQYETGDVADSDEPFKARYTLMDSHQQFRPRRTASKPRIEGPQTALVVGASGDEIYTDDLGRVKVQFDWDRKGERDNKVGCWIRVAQVWAGKQWGAMHIPRVGQEVIVEFLDGDPDRPIITGRVYNKDNMPPYKLPDNKTQSGIKSRSSKGGTDQNFNEIRFEDLKGKEELHVQAERDMSTTVKRNESLSVGGDRSITVSGNQAVTISGGGQSPIHSTTKVTGKYDLDVSDTIHIKAPTSITLECPGTKLELLPGKMILTAGDGSQIVLDANVLHKSNAGAKIVLDANVLAQSVPGSKVVLDANAAMEGTAKATVQAPAESSLTTGPSTVKASPADVKVSAPMVDVSGSAMVSITGGVVKVNG